MRKLLLIAWHEYKKHVLRKRFLGALLAPLLFMGIGAIVAVITVQSFAVSDIGVVKEATARSCGRVVLRLAPRVARIDPSAGDETAHISGAIGQAAS